MWNNSIVIGLKSEKKSYWENWRSRWNESSGKNVKAITELFSFSVLSPMSWQSCSSYCCSEGGWGSEGGRERERWIKASKAVLPNCAHQACNYKMQCAKAGAHPFIMPPETTIFLLSLPRNCNNPNCQLLKTQWTCSKSAQWSTANNSPLIKCLSSARSLPVSLDIFLFPIYIARKGQCFPNTWNKK